MALGTLSLSTVSGVQGRRFAAKIAGLTTGRVEIGGDGSPGFSVVNGMASSNGLPYPTSTVVLREYDPGATVSVKETRIDITAITPYAIMQQATAALGQGRKLLSYSVASTTQADGSTSYSLYVRDDLGATTVQAVGGAPSGLPNFASAVFEGDSITVGLNSSSNAKRWTSLVAAAKGATELNQGISGTVLQHSFISGAPLANNMRDRFVADVSSANKREKLFLAGGRNDARQTADTNFNVTAYAREIREMISAARCAGYAATDIVIVTPFWQPDILFNQNDPTNNPNNYTRAYYESWVAAAAAAAAEFGVYYYDAYAYMRDNGGAALISSDNIHPNDAGHLVIEQGAIAATTQPNGLALLSIATTNTVAGQLDVALSGATKAVTNYTLEIAFQPGLGFGRTITTTSPAASFADLSARTYCVRARANYADGTASPWAFAASAIVASGVAVAVEDSFTMPNGQVVSGRTGEIGATWTAITGYSPGTGSVSLDNRLYGTTATCGYSASGAPASADYYVEAELDFLTKGTDSGVKVAGRIQAGANTHYLGRYNDVTSVWEIAKVVAGTQTSLTTAAAARPTGVNAVRLRMQGATISLIVNGTQVASVTDSSITGAGTGGFVQAQQSSTVGQHIKRLRVVG